jgi:acyl-CoA thioesterase
MFPMRAFFIMPNTDNDRLAKTLQFETLESKFGSARVRAIAKDEFLNGVNIAHGGFLFSLADFASALATNTDERVAISSSASMNFLSPCPQDEVVIADAKITYSDVKTALVDVAVSSENNGAIFAMFQSRVIFKKI